MMVCHNMVGGKGVAEATVVKVENEEGELVELPEMGAGAQLVFVHNTSFGKVYIIKSTWIDTTTGHEYKCLRFYKDAGSAWDLLYVCETDGIELTAVGNILIVNIPDEGLQYIRYKSDDEGYSNLGNKLPDIDIQFALEDEDNLDKIGVVGDKKVTLENGVNAFGRDMYHPLTNKEFMDPEKWRDGAYNDSIFGCYNYLQNNIRENGYFSKPFLVRYALKMYDGNYIMQSSPILMTPSLFNEMHVLPVLGGNSLYFHAGIGSSPHFMQIEPWAMYPIILFNLTKLKWKINGIESFGDWKDIIQEICVFVTPDISSYTSSGEIKFNGAVIEGEPVFEVEGPNYWVTSFNGKSFTRTGKKQTITYISATGDSAITDAVHIEMPKREGSVKEWIEEASQNFRLFASFSLDELRERGTDWNEVKAGVNLNNLNVKEQLADGYRVRTEIKPSFMHTYNNRLNLANLVLKERETFPIGFVSSYATSTEMIKAEVYIEEDGVWNKTETEQTLWAAPNDLPGFFYYPNPNAKYLHLGDKWMKLNPHPFLNGAYYLNEELTGYIGVGTPPEITVTEEGVPRPNYIYTSEVDNPFVFPALGVNQIGSGKIKAIKSATKAMSEGTAFGTQPLYVFTEDGIFALSVNGVGLYDRAAPLSRETISDASKVLSIDNSVIFLNDRGLMELNGSRTRCLSEKLTDRYCTVNLEELKNWGLVEGLTIPEADASGTGAAYGIACDFMGYIKGNARLAFDYINYRIYVFSDEKYAYVYDISTKQWSTCASSMHSSVEGFPATFINIKQFDENGNWVGTKVCQFSSDDGKLVDGGHVLWLTRPLKFGEHDVLKTVRRVIARGRFSDKDNLTLALWGSRNMVDWVYVGGVKKGVTLPRLSGTPYKYFIVGGSAKMSNEDMLSRLTMEKSERYVNKPR